jgi:hypothetical protein
MSLLNRLDLRAILTLDAIASGAMGLLLLLGAGFLDGLFDLPVNFLRVTGAILLPWAGALVFAASRQPVSRPAVRGIIVINVAWVVGSLVLLAGNRVEPSALGIAFVIVQAIAVAAFATVQLALVTDSASRARHAYQP